MPLGTGTGGDPETRRQSDALRAEVQAGLDGAERDRRLLDRLVDIRSAKADDPDGSATDAAYADAFRDAGIDLAALPPAEAGARIKARPTGPALALAAALDDWSAVRRRPRRDRAGAKRLPDAARAADPDPWPATPPRRPGSDGPGGPADRAAPRPGRRGSTSWAPPAWSCWARPWPSAGDPEAAEAVLRAAPRRHPATSGSTTTWAVVLRATAAAARRRSATTRRPGRSARRRRTSWPTCWRRRGSGRGDRRVPRPGPPRPTNGRHLGCLGTLPEGARPRGRGRADPRRGRRSQPRGDPAQARRRRGPQQPRPRPAAPRGSWTRRSPSTARRSGSSPTDAQAHYNLGTALRLRGSRTRRSPNTARRSGSSPTTPRPTPTSASPCTPGEAGRGDRRVPRGDPAQARLRRGPLQPRRRPATARASWPRRSPHSARRSGSSPTTPTPTPTSAPPCSARGSWTRRSPQYREAIRLKPDDSPVPTTTSASPCTAEGKLDEAIAEYREAIRLKPDDAEAHTNLGFALLARKLGTRPSRWHYREAIRLKPDAPTAHTTSAALGPPGRSVRGHRRIPRGDPAQARRRRGPHQPRHRPARPGEAGRGDRRVPRGDPAQARLRRGPHQPRHRPAGPGQAATRRSPNTARRSGSSPTTPRPTTTSASPCDDQGKLDEAIAEYREAIRLKPDDAAAHNNLGIALHAQGKLRRGDRRIPRGDPAQARLRRGPQQPRQRPASPGEARRGDRRIPRGDPAQARLRRGPQQPRHRPASPGEAATRRSPNTARRSGSSPTTPRPTTTSASPCEPRGSWTRRSPNTARRSGSSPTTPRPTINLGSALHGIRARLDEAIAEFREAIRLKPDYAEAHNNLGIALKAQGKLDEAIAEYRAAIRLKPDDVLAEGPQQPRHRP